MCARACDCVFAQPGAGSRRTEVEAACEQAGEPVPSELRLFRPERPFTGWDHSRCAPVLACARAQGQTQPPPAGWRARRRGPGPGLVHTVGERFRVIVEEDVDVVAVDVIKKPVQVRQQGSVLLVETLQWAGRGGASVQPAKRSGVQRSEAPGNWKAWRLPDRSEVDERQRKCNLQFRSREATSRPRSSSMKRWISAVFSDWL